MKKIKLLTPILGIATITGSLLPLTACAEKEPAVSNFETDPWSTICYYCNKGLAKLKEVYKKETFVGLERKVKINGVDHLVKVIGEDHDTISGTSSKAALTFELFNLLSDNTGETISSKWDATNNWNYTTSILHDNLNGGSKKTWTTSAIDMLTNKETGTEVLKNNIKKVDKKVALSRDSGNTYSIETYSTSLFPLSLSEINESDKWRSIGTEKEGEPYSYWKTHSEDKDRKKGSVNGAKSETFGYYKLTSPVDYAGAPKNQAYVIDSLGSCNFNNIDYQVGVTFAFCI